MNYCIGKMGTLFYFNDTSTVELLIIIINTVGELKIFNTITRSYIAICQKYNYRNYTRIK